MTRRRKILAGLLGLAMTLGVPAALVLGTSAPALACFSGCAPGDAPLFSLTVTPTTVVAGSPVTATLWIHSGDYAPSDVSDASTFSITSGTCTGNVCTPEGHGAVTITGVDPTFSSSTTSATVTVLPVPDHLTIYLDHDPVTAGQPVTFTIWRAGADGTAIDDVTSQATVTLDGGPCSAGTCTAPAIPGSYTLAATDASLSGTTDVLVQAPVPARLVVTPAAHGVWNNDYYVTFPSEAYDAAGNDLGNTSTTATYTVSPDGSCDGAVCTADTAGPHTVTATYLGATGSVTLDATAPAPTVVSLLLDARVGEPYTGSVLSFSDDTASAVLVPGSAPLPPGLTLTAQGLLTGTPTLAGTYTFDIRGGDGNGLQQKPVTITIDPGTVTPPPPVPEPPTPQPPVTPPPAPQPPVAQPPASQPTVSISGATVREGNSRWRMVLLTLRLSAASGTPVTVTGHTVNGTAVSGRDYLAEHGTVTIPAGRLSVSVPVWVRGDRAKEKDETFTVVLTGATGATLGTSTATVTITNDD